MASCWSLERVASYWSLEDWLLIGVLKGQFLVRVLKGQFLVGVLKGQLIVGVSKVWPPIAQSQRMTSFWSLEKVAWHPPESRKGCFLLLSLESTDFDTDIFEK